MMFCSCNIIIKLLQWPSLIIPINCCHITMSFFHIYFFSIYILHAITFMYGYCEDSMKCAQRQAWTRLCWLTWSVVETLCCPYAYFCGILMSFFSIITYLTVLRANFLCSWANRLLSGQGCRYNCLHPNMG